jgi:tetratricopeptide (TPR) repeat protein
MKTCLFLLLAACTAQAASIPGGREAWQKLLAMPAMSFQFSFGWTADDGLTLSSDKPDPDQEIPKLRAQLRDGPADAALYWQMSRIYSRAEDYKKESNALARAITLYRQRLEAQPENVEVLTGFGLALSADVQVAEAEAVLRRAVRLGPKDWRAWSALAQWHTRKSWKSFEALLPTNRHDFMGYMLHKAAKKEIPVPMLEAAEKSVQEAAQCSDRAIELVPKEPLAYANRVQTRSAGNVVTYLRSVVRGDEPDPLKSQLSLFSTNVLADLWRVAQLSPDDPRAHCMALSGQLLVAAAQFSKTDPDKLAEGKLLSLLPDVERRSCVAALARLQELSQTRPSADAALALETTAMVKMAYLDQNVSAEADARRAVELVPSRDGAWDLLMSICVTSDRIATARSLAEKRLQVKDTTHNRIIAAKLCYKLGLLTEAKAHADAALKMEPDGYLPNMSALVITLKRSKDEDAATLAGPFFNKVQGMPEESLTNDQKIEAYLNMGIACVLVDEPDAARKFLEAVLKGDKDNKTAREALGMLAGK